MTENLLILEHNGSPRAGSIRSRPITAFLFSAVLLPILVFLEIIAVTGERSAARAEARGSEVLHYGVSKDQASGGAAAVSTVTATDTLPAQPVIWTQIPFDGSGGSRQRATGSAPKEPLPMGSRIVVFDPVNRDRGVINITPGFAAAGRPDVSFDGRHILFIAKRLPGDPFSLWEMKADGSDVRQITDGMKSCAQAIYLSTIYTIDADQPVYQIAFLGRADGTGIDSLYTCRLDGSDLRRITFSPDGVSDPLLLSDGRLLFSLRSASNPHPSITTKELFQNLSSVGTAQAKARGSDGFETPPKVGRRIDTKPQVAQGSARLGSALFTVNTDGTDVFPFAAVHEPPAMRSMPCETPDGWIVYVESSGGYGDPGGWLIAVSRTRSLHTRRVIADDPDGLYHSPSPLPDGRLLASYRSKRGGNYGVYVLDSQTGKRLETLYDDPDWHDVYAVALSGRPEPAGRSSVVRKGVETGQLYCLDAYISNTPAGRDIKRGRIKRLRIIQARTNKNEKDARRQRSSNHPQIEGSKQIPGVGEVMLGEVPVEADGSFFLEVPAGTPLRLETLDAGGKVLQSMHTWIWVMPNERRGCIGCHEDRELTPPNRHVSALRKDPIPVGVTPRGTETQKAALQIRGAYSK